MKNIILALFLSSTASAAGVLINGNQINPKTAISISTFTQTGSGNSSFAGNLGIGTVNPCSTCTLHIVGGASILGKMNSNNFQVAVTSGGACSTSPCTLTASTPGVASITRLALGEYQINFNASYFTAAPVCTVSGLSFSAAGYCTGNGLATTSSWIVVCYKGSTTTSQDDSVMILCFQP